MRGHVRTEAPHPVELDDVSPNVAASRGGTTVFDRDRRAADGRTTRIARRERSDAGASLVVFRPAPGKRFDVNVGADSAELNYFNVARSGYRFDDKGKLIRADWRETTYRYQITRGPDVDVASFARRWAEDDKRGAGVGALSPRDTSHATVGGAAVTVEYSRPAARGRNIWGDVVQFDKVWRLGADMATHFATTSDLMIGGIKIPTGRYTIWMELARNGTSYLIVNKRVNIFGTMYNPDSDFVQIPLERVPLTGAVERLTLGVVDGKFRIAWGDAAWVAPIVRASP